MKTNCDVLIIGGGVVGIATGISILEKSPKLKVVIAEKEKELAMHASGRNSGVLHAGFYYSPDSLKAKFCREGNLSLRKLAKKYNIPIRDVGKVVVARSNEEISRLEILYERGIKNGVELELHDEKELRNFEPLAVTSGKFLWSPNTGVSDPKAIIQAMLKEYLYLGGKFDMDANLSLKTNGAEVFDSTNSYMAKHIVNASGAQSDKISRSLGVGTEYAMLPFMGVYRATNEKNLPLKRLVYPVPHPINPFLGVHFTLTLDGKVKIGPTAIPIAGREQYSLLNGWSASDLRQAFISTKSLIAGKEHNFGEILKSEWPKILKRSLVRESTELVPLASQVKDWQRKPPGIRAQLVHLQKGKLEQDFVVKNFLNSTHVLNAVSPGWTSSLPFGNWIASQINF